ncbi:hypothetical protein F1880_007249 [Penicillium rolfsii]|nr:hypothetical protein F1880_007249 [Penicillium rolfsii]
MHLTNELLRHMIDYTSTEDFVSLALICEYFHTLCTPRELQQPTPSIADFPYSNVTLIAEIALEAIVAHSIHKWDFTEDRKVQGQTARLCLNRKEELGATPRVFNSLLPNIDFLNLPKG